jgi:Flp pilus assembly protein TadG
MRRRVRATGDRGAVLVEFALVFPILAMLLFGMLSAGMAWNTNLSLAHGARAAGRYAATLPTYDYDSLDDYLDAVAARVVGASDGNLASGVTGRIVCVAYVHPAGTATLDHTRRRYETTTVARADSTCFDDGQSSSEKRVQVMVERGSNFETGLWSRSITLHQQVVFRYEISDGL